jgi:hypothetical protein
LVAARPDYGDLRLEISKIWRADLRLLWLLHVGVVCVVASNVKFCATKGLEDVTLRVVFRVLAALDVF